MFCKNCGNEIDDNADVCIKCGHAVKPVQENEKDYNEPKTEIGVLLGLFLGVIGLLIYPANTIARKTFIKAWGITFCVSIGVILVIYLIAIIAAVGTMSYY